MTPFNKQILKNCILRSAERFEHQVLQVDVDEHYVYILVAGGEGEWVRYAHSYGDVDLAQALKGDMKLALTPA
jgi:hypothetical protein